MNDEELQQKIDRLLKVVSDREPEPAREDEREPAHPGHEARASEPASPTRDEGELDDRLVSWPSSSSSAVPSRAAKAVPTSSAFRRAWGPSLTAAVKANMRRLALKDSMPPQEAGEARHEGEEAGGKEFAVSRKARKMLASIGHSLEQGDLQSWELHHAAAGLSRRLLKSAGDRDPVVTQELPDASNFWIRMSAGVPDLGVQVSVPVSRALHALPEGRAVVGQLVAALMLLRLHGVEPASLAPARRAAKDRLLRQPLSEIMKLKAEVRRKQKQAKKEAQREKKAQAKAAKKAKKGAARTVKEGAGEPKPVGRQNLVLVSRVDALRAEVVQELQRGPRTMNELSCLFGGRLKKTARKAGESVKFKPWLLQIKGAKWDYGGKHRSNPLLTLMPSDSQRDAQRRPKRSRSRSPGPREIRAC